MTPMTRPGRRSAAKAIARRRAHPLAYALLLSLSVFVVIAGALSARAEGDIIKSHGISTFGDLKYPVDFPHLDYVNPGAPKGGEISQWTMGGFDNFNAYTRKGRAVALATVQYESLLAGISDEIGAAYGLLAESLEYPEDRSWVIFHLRPEARFSDGTPLTAEDVVWSFEKFRDEGLPSFSAVLNRQVASGEVLDQRTVKYVFTESAPKRDVIQLVGGLPVLSKAWVEARGLSLEDDWNEPGIGSGPYLMDSYESGERVVYRRNPDYWGETLPINVGRNNFDRIRIEYFADTVAAFEGFKAGVYTFRRENFSKNWATAYNFPAIDAGHVVKRELPDGNKATGQSFVFNLRREKFADPRVREAIALMFNFEWSNEALFFGAYARVNSFWENSYLAAEGLPGDAERALLDPIADLLPPGVLSEPAVMAPVSGARQLDRKNLRRASKLLDEAGWEVGPDGMRRNADGELLNVEFLEDSPSFERIVNPFVENLRKLGVNAKLDRVDPAQATQRERDFDFDLVTDQINMGYEPGPELLQYFGSEDAETSVFNTAGLKSPAVDALIKVVMEADTKDRLVTAVKALDRVLRAERFWVPQWYNNTHRVAYFDMYEHPENLPPYSLGEMDFWWHNPDKEAALKAAGALR